MVSSFYGSTNMFFSCRCRCRYRYRLLQIKGAKNRYLCCRTVFKHKGSRASLKYFHVLLLYTSIQPEAYISSFPKIANFGYFIKYVVLIS